jgi:hypothetical protein
MTPSRASARLRGKSGYGSDPLPRAAEHGALGHACPCHVANAAHGVGQPAVVELQGSDQIRASRHRCDATQRPGWTVPRRRGCGEASTPAARSRRSTGGARCRPTAAGRPAARGGCRGPGRSSTGRRPRAGPRGAAASSASATVWARSSNRAARFRSARSPARSSRSLMARTWPRRWAWTRFVDRARQIVPAW